MFLQNMSVNPTGRAEDAAPLTDEGEIDEAAKQGFLLQGKIQSYGIGGICDELPSNKVYETKEEFEMKKQEKFETMVKELSECQEMQAIKQAKRLWVRELEMEEDSSSEGSESEDKEGEGNLRAGGDEDADMQEEDQQQKVKAKKSLFPEHSAIFGGLMPSTNFKIPIIKPGQSAGQQPQG